MYLRINSLYLMSIRLEIEGEAIMGLLKLKRMLQKDQAHTGYQYKTPTQVYVLTKVFELTNYPSCKTRNDLAVLLNMSPRSIQIWLQNSRAASRDSASARRDDTGEHGADGPTHMPSRVRIINNQDISTRYLISLVLECSARDAEKESKN